MIIWRREKERLVGNVVFCYIKFIGKGKSIFYMRMWYDSLEYLNIILKWDNLFLKDNLFI